MDIDLFRKILEELNPIFWNKKIDRMLQESNYPNRTPIESAKWRYVIALRDLEQNQDLSAFPKSAAHRRSILYEKNPEKKRRDKLFREACECLTPLDKVYDVLRKKFTSSFAEQVLLTHEDLIRNFVGTADEHIPWTKLLVCMSHKDFWCNLKQNVTNLSEDQVDLLNWFNDEFPAICLVPKYGKRSGKTNYRNAHILEGHGFIQRPAGKQKGYVITENGREYISEHY